MKTGYRTERLEFGCFLRGDKIQYELLNEFENRLVKAVNNKLRRDRNALSKIVNLPITEQEEKIVLTFIQWLGTSVGEDFLKGDVWFNYELANQVAQCKDHPLSLTSREYEIVQNAVAWGKSSQGKRFVRNAYRVNFSQKDIDFFLSIDTIQFS